MLRAGSVPVTELHRGTVASVGQMLQGRIAAYDLFCMLLEREGFVQLAYKHAVSTVQPAHPVDLSGDWDGDSDSD